MKTNTQAIEVEHINKEEVDDGNEEKPIAKEEVLLRLKREYQEQIQPAVDGIEKLRNIALENVQGFGGRSSNYRPKLRSLTMKP